MRRGVAVIIGVLFAANGSWMIAVPVHWYGNNPGVTATGPANAHFIRDVGCAYLVVAVAMVWLACSPRVAWPAALVGGGFLLLHALIHVWDTAAGREHAHRLLTEIPTVILPAILVCWLAWPPKQAVRKEL
jgi:hypothetical protein